MTTSEAARLYLIAAELRLRPRTLSNRRSQLRQLCTELGATELEQLDANALDTYSRSRLAGALRPVSVNTELRALGALRSWAQAQGLAVGAKPRQLPERPAFSVRSWTPAEVQRLFSSARKVAPAIYALVVCVANTGLRRGEALALRWEHVDLVGRMIRIWPTDDWTTKSGRPREVPINDDLYALLSALPRRCEWVFPSSQTGGRWVVWPQRSFDRARDAAGLTGGPHRLRHSYATEFLAQGGELATLAQILGHSDERVTRLYAHLRPEHLAAARNVVRFPVEGTAPAKKSRLELLRRLIQSVRKNLAILLAA